MRRLFLGAVIVAAVLVAAPAAGAAGLLVPSYFYPSGTPDPWSVMCDTMNSSASLAILNPDSGPGRAVDPNYVAAVADCHVAGQRVVGYVATKDTHKSIASVERAVDTYYGFYPTIDGIFFDNMSQRPDARASCKGCAMTVESYYSQLYDFVHATWPGAIVVGNPGAPATTSWQLSAPAADVVVTFEGSAASYGAYAPPSWVLAEPADKIANIVYAAPSSDLASVCSTGSADNAGLLYVTDGKLKPNPYAALPSYWSTETTSC